MKITRNGKVVCLEQAQDFSSELIFECGQAFRWKKTDDGAYMGIAKGAPLKVVEKDGCVLLECANEADFDNVWYEYFDLGCEYDAIRGGLSGNLKLAPAIEYGKGIRILRQDFWEALCSFIISQCNNIPRIKGIINSLCINFGKEICFDGEHMYTFPEASVIADLSEDELGVIRSGYRAKYLISAAKAMTAGELYGIDKMSTEDARKKLMSLNGVGRKVADCVLLYGLGRMEVYPVDVWMKRVAEEFFEDKGFDGSCFGEYAGLAQQYLFHYIRGLNGK